MDVEEKELEDDEENNKNLFWYLEFPMVPVLFTARSSVNKYSKDLAICSGKCSFFASQFLDISYFLSCCPFLINKLKVQKKSLFRNHLIPLRSLHYFP